VYLVEVFFWPIEHRTAWYSMVLPMVALIIYQVLQSVWPWWSLALSIILLILPPTLIVVFYLVCAAVTTEELG